MRLRKRKKFEQAAKVFLGSICAIMSFLCFATRIPAMTAILTSQASLFSARFVLPSGSLKQKNISKPTVITDKISPITSATSPLSDSAIDNLSSSSQPTTTPPQNPYSQPETPHSSDEKTYPIIESQFGAAGLKYENFYIKKTIEYPLNVGEELARRPDFSISKDGAPQVLIVHTHTSEAYIDKDQGFYYESFYPRSTDYSRNVTRVGNAIAEQLKNAGIGVIHDLTYHDDPSYNGSYSRSAQTIKNHLAQNPSIKVVLDIHRDAIGDNESGKIKPTFVFDGKKAAQIMIMSGCDTDGSLGFPDWEHNLRLALRLQQKAETLYPGITRPMYFGEVKYNMDITHGSLLIEVGTDANTLEEAVYTGSLLGNALSQVLEELVG